MVTWLARWRVIGSTAGVCALVLTVAIRIPSAPAQTVFTWTDDSGVVHFSDSPPPAGQKYEQRGAVPVEPVMRRSDEAAAPAPADESSGGGAPAAADASATDTTIKAPARVILTSKEASPRGPETRHVIGTVKNVGGQPAGRVGVTAHIVDVNGRECSNEEIEVVPATLEAGETGNFDGTVNSPCFVDGGTVDAEAHWD